MIAITRRNITGITMTDDNQRDLTDLEYVVLGFISIKPQSGYSIKLHFEVTPSIRWSASPGSIYPMLKRLESSGYVEGSLDAVHETRPRKMYVLTEKGEQTLDSWIREPPTNTDVAENRDVMMLKFLFAENWLEHEEVLAWLNEYEEATARYVQMFELQRSPTLAEWSHHQFLIVEMALMELNMQRSWIQLAKHRLEVEQLRAEVRNAE